MARQEWETGHHGLNCKFSLSFILIRCHELPEAGKYSLGVIPGGHQHIIHPGYYDLETYTASYVVFKMLDYSATLGRTCIDTGNVLT